MKILFLSAANSIHTVKWVNALVDRGHELYLVYNAGHDPKQDKINNKVHLHCLKHSGTKGYYLNALELRKYTRKINPDVINVHYASGYGTLARISKIGPILLSIWGSDVYKFPYESRLKNIILKKNINYATKLASTSFCMAEQLRKIMSNSNLKIDITPFGVDIDIFSPERFVKKETDTILLGNIKMLKPIYGITEFVKAVNLLLQNLKKDEVQNQMVEKIKVEIYGEGEQKTEIENLIQSLKLEKVISLKGRIPNTQVPEILNTFDIFCATSIWESFGVAVVEAMAMEIPVVVSDVDGFKEVVEDEETGIIVPRGDEEKIADALKKLVCSESYRKKLGTNGRQRVLDFFDFQKNVDTMEELYRELEGMR